MVSIATTSSRAARLFYGWWVLIVAAAAMVGTLPGRTQGLGLITEPLLVDLGLGRVSYAQINFWATIAGSAGALGVGRALDRFGSRVVLTGVAVALGVVVSMMSRTTSVAGLIVWATLTRALGQSALSVVSLAMIGQWFVRRIDTAMAVYAIVISVGFMIAFPTVGALIQQWGWRTAWLAIGLALIAVLAPLALAVVRPTPEAIGLAPDGDPSTSMAAASGEQRAFELEGDSWQTALRAPAFWIFAIGAALYGLVASGIGLFNESILSERGFGADVYYQSLVVTAMTALAGNFLGGWLAQRVRLPLLLATALGILAAGLAALPHVSTVAHVVVWASAMGLGGGLVMVLFFSVWARAFGRRHLGRIQGMAQALTVLASALGPLLLAWCVDRTGSYAVMFRILAAGVALTALVAWATPMPSRALGDGRAGEMTRRR
jgi:MFS family permease